MNWQGRILLVNPPTVTSSASYLALPLGLAQVASALAKLSPRPDIVVRDLALELAEGRFARDPGLPADAAASLIAESPDVCAFSVQCFNLPVAAAIIRRLKAARPECTILVGGHHAMLAAPLIAASLGVEVAAHTAEAEIGPDGPAILPPAFDAMPDLERYRSVSAIPTGLVEVSRGCPFQCSYCSIPGSFGRRLTHKPLAMILDEIGIWRRAGYEHVHLIDDTFTIDRRRVEALTDAISSRFRGLEWTVMTRADLVDAELLARMGAAGCTGILYGIDSGSLSTLRRIAKRAVRYPALADLALWHRGTGIAPTFYFLIDLHEDSLSDFEQTICAAARMSMIDPGSCRLNLTRIVPGTRLALGVGDFLTLNLDAPYADPLRETVGDQCDEVWDLVRESPRLYSTYYAAPAAIGRAQANFLARFGQTLLERVPMTLAELATSGRLLEALDRLVRADPCLGKMTEDAALDLFAGAVDSISEAASELVVFESWRSAERRNPDLGLSSRVEPNLASMAARGHPAYPGMASMNEARLHRIAATNS